MTHSDLARYYKMLFNAKTQHNFGFQEVEEMYVFEFDVYTIMLKQVASGGNGR